MAVRELDCPYYNVDVCEDDYNEGEGRMVNSWTEKTSKRFYKNVKELIADIGMYFAFDIPTLYYSRDTQQFVFDALVDKDNIGLTDSEYEEWKQGKRKAYNLRIKIPVTVCIREENALEYEDSKDFGFERL
jgi:hypothetical protein